MRLAGAIIALIAGIFATFAAGFTLFVGGVGGALQADRAGLVVALGWGGVAFSFVTIVLAAIGIGNKTKTPGFLLILSSVAGAILGGTLVAVFMALALIGGILVVISGISASKVRPAPVKAPSVRQCTKCNSTIAAGQAFCGNCGAAVVSLDQKLFAAQTETPSELAVTSSQTSRSSRSVERKSGNNWLAWVGGTAVVGLIGVFGALALASNSGNIANNGAANDPGATLAEEFKLGDLAVTVSSVEFTRFVGSGPFRQESSPTSVYLVVKYSYRNQGSQPLGIFETPRVSLIDERGVKYSPDIGAGAAHATEGSSNAKILSNVNPGVTVTESDVFEIESASAQNSSFHVVVEAGRHSAMVIVPSNAGGAVREPDAATPAAELEDITPLTLEDMPAMLAAALPAEFHAGVTPMGFFQTGQSAMLLTGKDSPEECHVCTGTHSLFRLKRSETGFIKEQQLLDFYQSGSWGKYNRDLQLTLIGRNGGPQYPGLVDADGYTAQGCTSGGVTVLILRDSAVEVGLEAPMGYSYNDEEVEAEVVDPAPHNADFAIKYLRRTSTNTEEFVVPYVFADGISLTPSTDPPPWTQSRC